MKDTHNDKLQTVHSQDRVQSMLIQSTTDEPAKHEGHENISVEPVDKFYVARNELVEPQGNQVDSSIDSKVKPILKVPESKGSQTIDYMSYAEYDAFKKGVGLADELNTLSPTMTKYINHSFDPANIEYMKDAMPLPYKTSVSNKKVVFKEDKLTELGESSSKSINLHHKLLSLHVGLSNRMSQKELDIIQTTEQMALL